MRTYNHVGYCSLRVRSGILHDTRVESTAAERSTVCAADGFELLGDLYLCSDNDASCDARAARQPIGCEGLKPGAVVGDIGSTAERGTGRNSTCDTGTPTQHAKLYKLYYTNMA